MSILAGTARGRHRPQRAITTPVTATAGCNFWRFRRHDDPPDFVRGADQGLRQCPGFTIAMFENPFVDDDRVDAVQALQGSGVSDQHRTPGEHAAEFGNVRVRSHLCCAGCSDHHGAGSFADSSDRQRRPRCRQRRKARFVRVVLDRSGRQRNGTVVGCGLRRRSGKSCAVSQVVCALFPGMSAGKCGRQPDRPQCAVRDR